MELTTQIDAPKADLSTPAHPLRVAFGLIRRGRDYSATFAVESFVLLSQLAVYKLAAHIFGQQGFSEYVLTRRVVSLLQPLLWLGLGIALPRYLALASMPEANKTPPCRPYYGATVILMGGVTLLAAVVLVIVRRPVAYLFFGAESYGYLVPPIALMLIGLGLHALAYSYLRGKILMIHANILEFMNLVVAPPVLLILIHATVLQFMYALGILWTCISLIAVLLTPWREALGNTIPEARDLLAYGLPRVPGDLLQMGLLTLPAIFVAHRYGIVQAGYVAFAISIVSMIGYIFMPISLVLLPKASQMLGQGAVADLSRHVSKLVLLTLIVSGLICLAIAALPSLLVRAYLGPGFLPAAATLRLAVLGAVPYSYFIVMRGVIDAFHIKAVNTRNLLIAFISFLVFAAVGQWLVTSVNFMVIAQVVGLNVLAGLSYREAQRILGRNANAVVVVAK